MAKQKDSKTLKRTKWKDCKNGKRKIRKPWREKIVHRIADYKKYHSVISEIM